MKSSAAGAATAGATSTHARRNVLLGAALVLVASALWTFLARPSEEERVKQTLARFAKVVALKENDNVLVRLGRLRAGCKELLDDMVRVDVEGLALHVGGREAFVESATKAGLVWTSADAEIAAAEVKIDEAVTTAKVDATVVVTGVRGGERRIDRRRVHFLLRKDGAWKISTIDVADAD
jgi:hypothetical protein